MLSFDDDDEDIDNEAKTKKFKNNLHHKINNSAVNNVRILDLLSKEASMVYFTSNINKKQKNLRSYFNNVQSNTNGVEQCMNILDQEKDLGEDTIDNNMNNYSDNDDDNQNKEDDSDDDDIDEFNENRLNDAVDKNIDPNSFKGFPFQTTVTEIFSQHTLPELFYDIPFPYQIGLNISYNKIYDNTVLSYTNVKTKYDIKDTDIFPK